MNTQVLADIAHCFADAFSLAGQAATYKDVSGATTSITAYVSDPDRTEMTSALSKEWIMEEADILVLASEIVSPEDGATITIGTSVWRIRSHVPDKTGAGAAWIMRCTHDERKVF